MSEGLQIRKGGKLIKTKWVFDHTKDEGSYVEKDITDNAISHLFDDCDLEEGVTLRDIFLVMNKELKLFDAVLRNWCEEIVTEGLTKPAKVVGQYGPDEIEYLELSKCIHYDKTEKQCNSSSRPDFGGVGYELKEDKLHSWGEVEWPKGHRIPWGISFSAANDLIDLPVKLDKRLKVYNDDHTSSPKEYGQELASYDGVSYTLGEILHGIIWELSFHGGPVEREKAGDELRKTADEVMKDVSKTS